MKRHQVFLSSTKKDLGSERSAVWQELTNLNYIVVGMETFPATPDEQMNYIKRQIDSSDYLVVIIGGKYGSVADDGLSFTEMEFDYAIETEVPTLVFPIEDLGCRQSADVEIDNDLRDKLAKFRAKATKNRTCKFWKVPSDLASSVGHALRHAEQTTPRPGWERSGEQSISDLIQKNAELTDEIASLSKRQNSALTTIEFENFRSALNQKRDCSYENLETNIVVHGQISISEILLCVNVDGSITRNAIEDGLAYALSDVGENKDDKIRFEKIEVFSGAIDESILILHQYKALEMSYDKSKVIMSPGPNWLVAHRLARGMQ